MIDQNGILLLALEVLANDWADHHLPTELLLEETTVELLVNIEETLWQTNSGLSAELLRKHAPTFCEQFALATYRELGAPFGHPREVVAAVANG